MAAVASQLRLVNLFRGGRLLDGKSSQPQGAAAGGDALTRCCKHVVQSRRLYRKAHQAKITGELKFMSLNRQRLNWTRADNKVKLQRLVLDACKGGWHVGFLSDMHGHRILHKDADTKAVTHKDVDTICIEEFTLVIFGSVAFILSQGATKAWVAGGRQLEVGGTNILRISLLCGETKVGLLSIYCPTQKYVTKRLEFAKRATDVKGKLRGSDCDVVGAAGDWNTHIGNDYASNRRMGRHLLDTPTSKNIFCRSKE